MKVQRLMGRIYEPLLVPKLIRILRSTCTSLSDARGASERFKSVGEAQPTEKGTQQRALFCWLGRQICHYQLLEFVLSRFRCELFFVKV